MGVQDGEEHNGGSRRHLWRLPHLRGDVVYMGLTAAAGAISEMCRYILPIVNPPFSTKSIVLKTCILRTYEKRQAYGQPRRGRKEFHPYYPHNLGVVLGC